MHNQTCRWFEIDGHTGEWTCSSCAVEWYLSNETGHPYECSIRHCPSCGLLIEAVVLKRFDYDEDRDVETVITRDEFDNA